MEVGVVFPQTEIGNDPAEIRDFAQAVENMGLDHLLAFDHVLGASAERYDSASLGGSYRERHAFHEPFVLFGFLAGLTRRIGFATSVMVLPQRQTALVAKQAAEVDVLSGGKLRLGVGIGWNWVEYEALGSPYRMRAERQEEQIRVMRELWTRPLVHFEGKFHQVSHAGINPMPVQRPIPVWLGGMAEPVLRRVARLADGWFPQFPSMNPTMVKTLARNYEDPRLLVERVRKYAREVGRDPREIGIEARLVYAGRTQDDWRADAEMLREIGVSHVSIHTMRAGLSGCDAHLSALGRVFEAVRSVCSD